MEASNETLTSSPLAGRKMPRRHYKAEFERMCDYAAETMSDLVEVKQSRDKYKDSAATAIASRDQWRTIAVIQAIALIGITIAIWLQ